MTLQRKRRRIRPIRPRDSARRGAPKSLRRGNGCQKRSEFPRRERTARTVSARVRLRLDADLLALERRMREDAARGGERGGLRSKVRPGAHCETGRGGAARFDPPHGRGRFERRILRIGTEMAAAISAARAVRRPAAARRAPVARCGNGRAGRQRTDRPRDQNRRQPGGEQNARKRLRPDHLVTCLRRKPAPSLTGMRPTASSVPRTPRGCQAGGNRCGSTSRFRVDPHRIEATSRNYPG
jgi:hypothetical protein